MDFFEELDALYGKGDRNALEEYLENGLAKARRDGDGDMEVAILNEMGGFYRGVSEYSLAEDYFDEAMQLMRRRGQAGTYGYAVALMNRAGNARMSGDPYHAAALFLEAREILARDRDKSDYAYVSLLNNLALTYQDLGEPEKALACAEEALEIVRQGSDYEHEIATSLNNVASIWMSMGELGKAAELLKEALAIYDAMPEANVHHAAALNSMAVVEYRRGNAEAALGYLEKAAKLNAFFFGKNWDYYRILGNRAEILASLGRTEEASALRAEITAAGQ